MGPPDIVRSSALANADGWLEVDKFTLRHPREGPRLGFHHANPSPTIVKINTGIHEAHPTEIAAGLSNLLADSYTFYLQTHNFHWNVTAAFATDLEKKQPPKPQIVKNPDTSTTLFAPIVISNPLCLQCHGAPDQDIAPATLTAIRKLYPDDKATGYKAGELRGLWSITFPAGN